MIKIYCMKMLLFSRKAKRNMREHLIRYFCDLGEFCIAAPLIGFCCPSSWVSLCTAFTALQMCQNILSVISWEHQSPPWGLTTEICCVTDQKLLAESTLVTISRNGMNILWNTLWHWEEMQQCHCVSRLTCFSYMQSLILGQKDFCKNIALFLFCDLT